MELKIQYNKTALAELKVQLVLRESALPILKNKETALRQEVKNALKRVREMKGELEGFMEVQKKFGRFWQEFPAVVSVENIQIQPRKIIGVRVPEIQNLIFTTKEISWFAKNAWVPSGIDMMKEALGIQIRIMVAEKQLDLLYRARKKTTQKVNLYEKVQIPMLESHILKIKRFLEDEENISKAAQKIVKKRNDLIGLVT